MSRVRIALLLAALGITLSAGAVHAQEWVWGVSYGVAFPTGNTQDFTDDTSWRNISIEGRRVEQGENVSIGLTASWNVFFEKSVRTDQLPGVSGTVTGTQYRYSNMFPILANAHYYFGKPYKPRPFVGLNLGVYVIEERIDVGLITAQETNVHFGGAPEVGILFPAAKKTWFLNGRYNVTADAGNVPGQTYFTVSLGFASY